MEKMPRCGWKRPSLTRVFFGVREALEPKLPSDRRV